MIDLTTSYLGMHLKNPLVMSSSPLCEDIANIRKMEDAGASAVVLHSLFEEQITLESQELDQRLFDGTESFGESLTYFPDMNSYNLGPEGYLEHLHRAKAAVGIPIIGSLNGVSTGGWISYGKKMEEAGADALELNIYSIPTDPNTTGAEIEQGYCDLVSQVRSSIRIPVAVKLGPNFSSLPNMARRLERAGAAALVLFNRFYQPDFDLENLEVIPNLVLSNPHELLPRLHWVAILYGQVRLDLAVTGGVHTGQEVLKAMMAGARVSMMTSAMLKHGIGHLKEVQAYLVAWMEDHEYESIRQMQGSMARKSVSNPAAFERANYMKVLSSYVPRMSGP
jgi:dihydroorotate dehydrogenase (fumarate)